MDIERQYYYKNVSFKWIDLAYNSIPPLELSLQSPIEFIQRTHDCA